MSCFVIGNTTPVMIKIHGKLRLGKTYGHIQRQINRISIKYVQLHEEARSSPGQIG
jgi:hypothetical protein